MVLDFGKINIFIKFVILTFYISINDFRCLAVLKSILFTCVADW